MHAPERLFEILCHSVKRHIERRAPSDKYIVMSGAKPACGREPHYFPQATAHPVTLDGVSHLLRRGKAKTCRSRVAAFACLQHKCGGRYLDPGRRGQKFRSLPQPLHASNSCGGLRRLRRTAACGHVRDVPTGPFVHPLLPCARGNRDGVCARACSVDRSASRSIVSAALGKGGHYPPKRLQTPFIRARTRFRAAYKGGAWTGQCDC